MVAADERSTIEGQSSAKFLSIVDYNGIRPVDRFTG